MPPVRKFQKEDIIDTTYEIVKNEGFENVNARRIAKELNCSIQPVFHNFETMEELNKAVYEKIYNTYKEYIMKCVNKEKPYKEMGISYIKFAKDYPEFFKIIFMKETTLNAENFMMEDTVSNDIIKAGQTFTGLSYEEQKKFHLKVWIFTHGLSCLVATKTIKMSDNEIEELLSSTVWNIYLGFKKGDKNEKEII